MEKTPEQLERIIKAAFKLFDNRFIEVENGIRVKPVDIKPRYHSKSLLMPAKNLLVIYDPQLTNRPSPSYIGAMLNEKVTNICQKYFGMDDGFIYISNYADIIIKPIEKMKKKKIKKDVEESTSSASSGGIESTPLFGKKLSKEKQSLFKIKKKDIYEIVNRKKNQISEMTTTDSTGAFDKPSFFAKGKGKESLKQMRAKTNPLFRRNLWGGPDSKYVEINDKCKKFPYCTQGDPNNYKIVEDNGELMAVIKNVSKKYNISEEKVTSLIIEQIVDIYNKTEQNES